MRYGIIQQDEEIQVEQNIIICKGQTKTNLGWPFT